MNPLLRILPLLALALGTGCLSRPALVRETFLLPAMPEAGIQTAAPTHTLELRQLDAAEPFAGKSFVYRTGDFSYERDPYAEFMVPPAHMLRIPLSAHVRGAGVDLLDPGSPRPSTRQLEIILTELYGDFRPGPAPAAVATIHVTLSETVPTALPRVLLDKTYTKRVPAATRTAAVLVTAWNTALTQILGEVAAEVGAAAKAP